MQKLTCFKAYDIRGKIGTELNTDIAYNIGRAYAQYLQPQAVVLGADIRLTSESLKMALAKGLTDSGVDVIDLGMSGTEEVYFATWYLGVSGGIEVTASHNPIDYNGMKLIREEAKPISRDSGLLEIQRLAEDADFKFSGKPGSIIKKSILKEYVDHLFTYISLQNITTKKIVVNAGNGAAGHVIDAIEQRFREQAVPIEFIKIQHQPDGSFPHGIPNPLLAENRQATAKAVQLHQADMGIAWDGDFDRCFLFDEQGQFIEGYYIVGLLAEAFLEKNPGGKIIYDPRLTWNTLDMVNSAGGSAIQSKAGHSFIKEVMRKEDAVYGGEMSAHHYFRDFAYCDSGMIPWLLVTEMLCNKNVPLSSLVSKRMAAFPASGEINCQLKDPQAVIAQIRDIYCEDALHVDEMDGISIEYADWRFNLRPSNTEPVVRLNVETRQDKALLELKVAELVSIIEEFK